MANRVTEKLKTCRKCAKETIHHKNTKEMSWAMHIFFTIITAGIWLVILIIIALLTKPLGEKWTCSICGAKSY